MQKEKLAYLYQSKRIRQKFSCLPVFVISITRRKEHKNKYIYILGPLQLVCEDIGVQEGNKSICEPIIPQKIMHMIVYPFGKYITYSGYAHV